MKIKSRADILAVPKNATQVRNINEFLLVVDEYPMLNFPHPSPLLAPYHVTCRIGQNTLNFYPAKAKVFIPGRPTRTGYHAMCKEVDWALDEDLRMMTGAGNNA